MPTPTRPRPRPRTARPAGSRARLSVERCEPRVLLATYQVTTNADSGPGSLRSAIAQVNLDSTPDLIQFAINGPSTVIQLASALDPITNSVTIDGTSQPGFVDKPLVVLDGSTPGIALDFANGLTIQASGTVVQGLGVINFRGSNGGIFLNGVNDCVLRSDYIGVDPATLMPAPNRVDGVNLFAASNNVIGQPGAGNVIGGNRGSGINALFGSSNLLIQGNFLGISTARSGIGVGPANLSNGVDGIRLNNSTGATIGGTAQGAGNVISLNVGNGVDILAGSGHLVLGNLIGTDSSGLSPRGNGGDGIFVGNSANNTIGGLTTASANVVSGNAANGINVNQAGATGNLVQGNLVGVDLNGRNFLGNSGNGVRLSSATGNRVLDNVVSSNNFAGVFLSQRASGNLIAGNLVGTNQAGDQLSNLTDGVFIIQSANNTVGGTTPDARNVISANTNNGISIRGPLATGNLIEGNYLGTDPSGRFNLGNVTDGVFIQNAPGNTIGGTIAGSGNVISRNRIGVNIETFLDTDLGQVGGSFSGGRSDGNVVQGNLIGTDFSGIQPLGNFQEGVLVVAGSSNSIGGTGASARNVIANNFSDGVGIEAGNNVAPTVGNVVQGNIIGLDASGTRRAANRQDGVHLIGAIDTLVGGTATGQGNVISGNTVGIEVSGASAPAGVSLNAVIQGNIVGLGSDGLQLAPLIPSDSPLRNSGDGILVEQGARGVAIGGTAPGVGNVLSGNGSSGIRFASGSAGNLVQGNLIGVGIDGQTVLGNNQSGVFLGEGSNRNTVGGTVAGSRNVIAGNATGVTLTNDGTAFNLVEGNYVGLTIDGKTSAGNVAYGFLLLSGATANTVGGTTSGARNVISSNGQGITIDGPGLSGNLFQGNYVGLDASGSMARPNDRAGIAVNDSANNTIGGAEPGAGNVISGNTGPGLVISGSSSNHNLVAGNIIGLDATGTLAADAAGNLLGNANYGIQVDNAPGSIIGGETFPARNVISGNRQAGIEVNGVESAPTIISGNLIGTDVTGRVALGNFADGILVDNTPGLVIGGSSGQVANIISGNLGNGITIFGAGSFLNLIAGNLIGTDGTGTRALGNALSGVFVNGAPGVSVGGTAASLRNVISGNGQHGLRVTGAGSAGTVVQNNLIGPDATGRGGLGNGLDGVFLDGSASVTIGGTVSGSTNIVSGNGSSGVEFGGASTTGNVVLGNLIGTDYLGKFALPNTIGVFVNNAPFNRVGGSSGFSGNLISGNSGPGVEVFGVGAIGNAIQGNRLGTDLFGTSTLANLAGVFIDGAPGNLVGGLVLGSGNLLSGNINGGVIVQGTNASGNLIQGNLIGTDASGTRAIGSASPQQSGILLTDAPGNVVGGSVPTAANVLSGNVVGVVIAGFNAQGNLVIGNRVGTDILGHSAVPNTVGVYVNGSSSNTIGGSSAGFGNLISGNTSTGVYLFGPQTTRTVVAGNKIGTNLAGSAAIPNQQGIFVDASPSNTIGGPTKAAGNLISGNAVTGVYLFDGASGNLIQDNVIGFTASGGKLGNLQYGILFFNAANNVNDKSPQTGNRIGNSGIGNFREFTGKVTTTTTRTAARVSHPRGPVSKSSSRH